MSAPVSEPRRDLFGDISFAKGLLTWAQIRDILKRQLKYKEMGIPIRIGEVTIEMGLLNQTQVNDILTEQAKRRKNTAAPKLPSQDEEIPDDGSVYELGRFRLEKRLGGVMGTVYRGVDTQTNQTIALKVLPKTLAREAAFVERFKREVRANAALSHPNIVRIHDAGIEQGVFYMATEYIDGESLNQRLRREGALAEPEAIRISLEITRALAHAHAHNVLHRDIKPENIMISKIGEVKLADFGLAKMLADEQQITAEGIAVGTPHYIAPEQARALKETDQRADLYSLGATMFHIVTGRLPYEGDDGATIMRRHVFEATPVPRSVKTDMNQELSDVIFKLMAKDPASRYQTAKELATVLESFQKPSPQPPKTGTPNQLPPDGTPRGITRKKFD